MNVNRFSLGQNSNKDLLIILYCTLPFLSASLDMSLTRDYAHHSEHDGPNNMTVYVFKDQVKRNAAVRYLFQCGYKEMNGEELAEEQKRVLLNAIANLSTAIERNTKAGSRHSQLLFSLAQKAVVEVLAPSKEPKASQAKGQ